MIHRPLTGLAIGVATTALFAFPIATVSAETAEMPETVVETGEVTAVDSELHAASKTMTSQVAQEFAATAAAAGNMVDAAAVTVLEADGAGFVVGTADAAAQVESVSAVEQDILVDGDKVAEEVELGMKVDSADPAPAAGGTLPHPATRMHPRSSAAAVFLGRR